MSGELPPTAGSRNGTGMATAWARLIAAGAMAVVLAGAARADDAASRGARVVEEWCRMCHLRAGESPDPDMAPAFEEIVRREGRNEAYFVAFMREDHFPMTTFRLFDHEKADVVAFLLALQKQGTAPAR